MCYYYYVCHVHSRPILPTQLSWWPYSSGCSSFREGIASDSQGEEEDAACAATEPSPGTEPQTAPPPEVTTGGNAVAPSDPQLAASAAAQLRRRAADAALSRLAMAQQHPGGVADDNQGDSNVPPDIPSAAAAGDEDTDEEGLTKVAGGKESAAKLLVAAGVRTIGQLADRDEDELARKLRVLQAAVARSGDDSAGAGVGGEAGGGCAEVEESEERVDAEEVSEWVQAARGEELDEIMFEIVGSDDDVVEVSWWSLSARERGDGGKRHQFEVTRLGHTEPWCTTYSPSLAQQQNVERAKKVAFCRHGAERRLPQSRS